MKPWIIPALFAASCATARPAEYRGPVVVNSSELIRISPDVRVVADAEKPMFEAAGAFWLFHDAGWYRAASVHGPWQRDHEPPWQIRQVDQPYAYTHYKHEQRGQTASATETPSQELANPKQTTRMFDLK